MVSHPGIAVDCPISHSKCDPQRRLSFGTEGVSTPKKINMSRRLSTASDSSTASGLPRMRDCLLGQLHAAYAGLCKKVRLDCAGCCLMASPPHVPRCRVSC
jgi:hypothetical protein